MESNNDVYCKYVGLHFPKAGQEKEKENREKIVK